MTMVVFFVAAFISAIIGVYLFMKSDETAYNKASEQVKTLRADFKVDTDKIQKAVEDLSQGVKNFEGLCIQKMTELHDAQMKTDNQLRAMDLEILRLKEKIQKIQVRAVPTTHTVKLEISQPIPVKAVKRENVKVDLLERSGVKQKAKDH